MFCVKFLPYREYGEFLEPHNYYGKLATIAHVFQDAMYMYTGLDREPLLFCRGRLENVQLTMIYNVHVWPMFSSLIKAFVWWHSYWHSSHGVLKLCTV